MIIEMDCAGFTENVKLAGCAKRHKNRNEQEMVFRRFAMVIRRA
jgi:hypothetical protein